jgi:hypothetical protein
MRGSPALAWPTGFVPAGAPPVSSMALSRTSDRALAAAGAFCLKLFLLAQFLSLTRLFFSTRVGDGVTPLASAAGLLSVALLFPAVLAYGLRSGSPFGTLVAPARFWVAAVLVLSCVLFLYGWLLQGYQVSAALHDLVPYLVILGSVVLGSIPRVWQDIDRFLLVIFAIALVVNAAGMREMTSVVSESYAEDRAGIGIVAYRTQGALAFWPLLFLTARLRRPRTMFLIFAGVFFVLSQQILFQKRAPTFRIVLFALVFLFLLPRPRPRDRVGAAVPERRVLLLFVGTLVLALAVALIAAPWLFEGQLAGLLGRLSGQAYSGGPAAMLTWENERFFEVGMFFRTLEPHELVFGRGFGGYFIPDAPGWGVWLDDVQEFGRRQLHVGGLMPLFKGGLVLAGAYYLGLLLALVRGARSLFEPFAAAAFFVLILHALFLLQEGFFIMSVAFELVLVGLCMGHLLGARPPGPGRRLLHQGGRP